MSDDWQPGDLALCVNTGLLICTTDAGTVVFHDGSASPRKGSLREVVSVRRSVNRDGTVTSCGCVALGFAEGTSGIASRFRKIAPHQPDAEDRQTIWLMGNLPKRELA